MQAHEEQSLRTEQKAAQRAQAEDDGIMQATMDRSP